MMNLKSQFSGELRKRFARLSIFSRLALGYLTIIGLVVGVNLYILNQLQTLTELGTELVEHHYPAVETSKRLINSLFVQLKSDKQYLVLRDTVLLKEFLQEAGEFRKTLTALVEQERSEERKKLLIKTKDLHDQFQTLFLSEGVERAGRFTKSTEQYENQRDTFLDQMTNSINKYIDLHQASISAVLSNSHERAKRAETITQQLMVMALFLGMGLAGIASFSILRPLRRVQGRIRQIGQGQFGATSEWEVPKELGELVHTINWMGVQLQELDQMKAEFLANISHELRTPLASIREGTQLLLDQIPGPLTKDQGETLRILLESSQRLNQLIASLLDLSKMEANVMAYQFAPVDLNQLINHVVDKVKFLAERKSLSIELEGQLNGSRVQEVDETRIEQVIENLLANAMKFSPEGSTIGLTVVDQKDGAIKVSVSDSGPGIYPEDLPHIFERFYQGKVPGGRPQVGSGIGLALAKKVVEAHEGTIWAESELGKGTFVHFLLPSKKRRETLS
jgi:two-component system sensor histidine kinase GlrK